MKLCKILSRTPYPHHEELYSATKKPSEHHTGPEHLADGYRSGSTWSKPGRSEWCHRGMVETHGIYTSYLSNFSAPYPETAAWPMTCVVSQAKTLVMLLPPQKSHRRSNRAIKLHIGSKARWENPWKATSPSLTANHEQVQPAHQHL